MKRLLVITGVILLSNLALTAQRNCGLWLNEVPLVADTAANTIYATIEPGVGSTFKGTLRWDENRFSNVKFNGAVLENGIKGNLVATRHGFGNALVEFGNDGSVAQGNYIAVVIKGSRQKVLRVRAGF